MLVIEMLVIEMLVIEILGLICDVSNWYYSN
jgi:hypothetical protein